MGYGVGNDHTGTRRNGNGSNGKKPRQGGGTPVKPLLRTLEAEGSFTTSQCVEAIVRKFQEKGHTVSSSSLSSRMTELTQGGELHRPQSVAGADSAVRITNTAEDGRQSLSGAGRYARKCHAAVVGIAAAENKVRPHSAESHLD